MNQRAEYLCRHYNEYLMTRSQSFSSFLKYFSKEKLPVTLSEENVTYFSSRNPPIPEELIRRFIGQNNTEEDDEYTEYIACCKIPKTDKMHAVVYWKGGLLTYEYTLVTYNKNGVLIDRKVIAGTKSDGKTIVHSVATIDENWIINVVVGQQNESEKLYDPSGSKNMSLELMANGEITFSLD